MESMTAMEIHVIQVKNCHLSIETNFTINTFLVQLLAIYFSVLLQCFWDIYFTRTFKIISQKKIFLYDTRYKEWRQKFEL